MSTPPSTGRAPTEEERSWVAHALKQQQEAPKHLEETAKFLAAIISLTLSLLLGLKPTEPTTWELAWLIFAAALLLLSGVLSFLVLFPWRYKVHPQSPSDIKKVWGKITATKRRLLVVASGIFLLALLCGVVSLAGSGSAKVEAPSKAEAPAGPVLRSADG